MKGALVAGLLAFGSLGAAAEKVWLTERKQTFSIKVAKNPNGSCEILHKGLGQVHRLLRDDDDIIVSRKPQAVFEHDHVAATGTIVEVFGNQQRAEQYLRTQESCVFLISDDHYPTADEVRKIVDSGPSDNRIDVVFMGDGYTAAEKELHFEDMTRLTKDMFEGDTFSSYLPLFNIWGVFRQSAESGIGYYSTPKNTAFGLYRDGTELRGVYCSKPSAARDACRQTGPNACDFPSLIANDPYYGGLGGEFTISTSSLTTGTVVLRHEFGHNFGSVGEEYDGGSVYSGANSDRDLGNLKWKHWLTDPNYVGPEANALRVQDYAWSDLGKGPYTINFSSDGKYARWFMRFSVSGCEKPDSLIVTLDGERLPWNTSGIIDRSFTEIYVEKGLSAGAHKLVFESAFPPEHDMIRQLCSVSLLEYKNETEYHFGNDYVGAYPTYRLGNFFAGYRPNNEHCLMRNMTSTKFCSPCQENNWLQFLARMSLLDGVTLETGNGMAKIRAEAVPIGQLRQGGAKPGERYSVYWTHNGASRADLEDLFEFELPLEQAKGQWQVDLEYHTTEVRSDPRNLLSASETFVV